MDYIIGWILFGLGLVGLFIIIGRKFSILANIDVAEIQSEKNAQLKQQIIASQLKRRFGKVALLSARLLKPFSRLLRNSFDWLYDKLNSWQRVQVNREAVLTQEVSKRVDVLLFEAEELARDGRFEAAEKKYIEIIGLDPKNFRAFKDLGEVYLRKQSYNEAKQTLDHALRLKTMMLKEETKGKGVLKKDVEVSQIYFALAQVFEQTNDLAKAISYLKKALKIEKHNPRYLDRLIEVSILHKDKINALSAFEELKKTNPENQKLVDFKERIQAL